MKKKITIGILAHVDAGKTTVSEALLFTSGRIRTLGRVDHKNTYLDTNSLERERGITIFSKQARFSTEGCDFILLDTPGHVDFSPEAERTLMLLDYAILVVSGSDGIQNHTRTLWQLLELYKIPTFIFVNKTDIAIKLSEEQQAELAGVLSPLCVPFFEKQTKSELDERLALVSEDLLEAFLESRPIDDGDIASLISRRLLFPCLYGSALKLSGIEHLLSTLDRYTLPSLYSDRFGGRIYKIAKVGSERLTYMKLTGGGLSVRDEISYLTADGERMVEKIAQIRLYSGEKYETAEHVSAGEVCTVLGLSGSYAGQGLGIEADTKKPMLEPVMSYRIKLPPQCDIREYFKKLKELEEEEPSLHLSWNEELRQLEARLMGDIQIDLLKRLISDRFGIDCEIDTGRILYKEKAASRAIGIGHFEPLRHYAEVQLLIEPAPAGSGLIFDTRLPENSLDTNWQRLILSNLYEKDHRGILCGAKLTDTKITLVAGRAHQKHTEGGDFREATLRAVRHGLMRAGCVLLEPYYRLRLELPTQNVGRAMSDLQNRHAEFEIESATDDITAIVGRAPVATLHNYQKELMSYTGGKGSVSLVPDGYYPCHDQDEIVASVGYSPEADLENPPHSVFCASGAGFLVNWQDVEQYKHLDASFALSEKAPAILSPAALSKKYSLSDDDLEAIMMKEFGPIRRRQYSEPRRNSADRPEKRKKPSAHSEHKQIIIVDGYNFIFASEYLSEIASFSLEKARETLMDLLSSYVAFTKAEVTLVFDAYLVKDGIGEDTIHDGYRVVFTKQDQTADAFIEKMMFELGPNYDIKVVTGDRLVQYSAVSSGILRMTAKEFEEELTSVGNEISEFIRMLSENQK